MLTDLGLLTVSQIGVPPDSSVGPFLGGDTTYTAHSNAGSVRWMAPELLGSTCSDNDELVLQYRRTTWSDIYAFGMTMLEVCY